jgi:hypothetical protein
VTLSLSIRDSNGEIRSQSRTGDETFLVHHPEYVPGDVIVLTTDRANAFIVLQLDDAMAPALVYCTGGQITQPVPFELQRQPYSLRAFTGARHRLHARYARPEEINARRNLCLNPYDHGGNETSFPHATANVITRGEAQFAARNAIDGEKANDHHGLWPYTSWGINRDPAAALTVHLGPAAVIDEVVFYLRADFPHDAWWTKGTVTFSDGSREVFTFEKTGTAQRFAIAPRTITWACIDQLIKDDDPSPFPALTQIELWGKITSA